MRDCNAKYTESGRAERIFNCRACLIADGIKWQRWVSRMGSEE